jgi:hypothetical protein
MYFKYIIATKDIIDDQNKLTDGKFSNGCDENAKFIQKCVRGFFGRSRYKDQTKAALKVQNSN